MPVECLESSKLRVFNQVFDRTTDDTIIKKLLLETDFNECDLKSGKLPRLVALESAQPPANVCTGQDVAGHYYYFYRFPMDEWMVPRLFSPQVDLVLDRVMQVLSRAYGTDSLVRPNHVLIQLYRTGYDYISEHADKTLDLVVCDRDINPNLVSCSSCPQVVPGIVTVSFGADRYMTFRSKKGTVAGDFNPIIDGVDPQTDDAKSSSKRDKLTIPLTNGSVLVMGYNVNSKWMHAIRPDKAAKMNIARETTTTDNEYYCRIRTQRQDKEQLQKIDFSQARLSLTFRTVGTILSTGNDGIPDYIWGIGAPSSNYPAKEDMSKIYNKHEDNDLLLRAFATENKYPFSRLDMEKQVKLDGGYMGGFKTVNINSR